LTFFDKYDTINPIMKPPKATSWGAVASWYDELLEKQDGTYQKEVILPNLTRMLAVPSPLKGKIILDLACGQGFFSREFTKHGAQVVGTDIAKELIEIAQRHPDRTTTEHIKYHVASSDDLSFCPDASVDAVTIVLALQNIEKMFETIAECSRVLRPKGRLYLVLNHPSFRIPKHSSWQWAEDEGAPGVGIQYRRVDAYMSESRTRIDMNPGEGKETSKKTTVSFHRPLQVYVKALAKGHLAISRLEEWISHKQSKPGPRSYEENRIRKEIPLFLAIEAVKL
jgi:SAM-dependent methyltransferase